jgi:predicted phosphodiesterase
VQLLAGLPHPVELPVDGFGEVLFCHGTPRDDDEVVLVDSPLGRFAEVLADTTAETIVCGHTHMPFVRLADRRLIVNPGSVGMPYGRSGASWALLAGGGVALRRTAYDVEAACARIAASGFAGAAGWAEDYVRTPPSDAEALIVFTPRSV